MDINLQGPFFCCRSVVPHLLKSAYRRIVNIASIVGKEGNSNAAHYSASKAGVIALTKSLGKELENSNIAENAVAPAVIAKELQPLKSHGVFHTGMLPPGTAPLPEKSTFTLDPPIPSTDYKTNARIEGVTLSPFGSAAASTHALAVNLDYKTQRTVTLTAPPPLEIFDATTAQWSPVNAPRAELRLLPGGGKLLRVRL